MKSLSRLSLLSLLLFVTTSASAQFFSRDELGQVSRATGYILAAHRGIEKINAYCGGKYSYLRSTARQATAGWEKRNGFIVKHAKRLINLVISDIESVSGRQKAKEIRAKMFGYLESTTDSLVGELRKMPGGKRKSTCDRWVKSVQDGTWDIRKKNPTAYNVIDRYKDR